MMLTLMAKLAGCRKADIKVSEVRDEYEIYRLVLRPATTSKAADDADVMMRVVTQIARDLGEQFNLRRCGVVVDGADVVVTVPKKDK